MKIVIPVLLIAMCLFLLVGCFDLPTPEGLVQSDAHGKDVRKLAGGSAAKTPLHNGQTTRAKVIALLGPPTYESADSRAIGYTSKTFKGFQFIPLCGIAGPDEIGQYVLRLDFDDQDVLKSYALGHGRSEVNDGIFGPGEVGATNWALSQALENVNAADPKLLPIKKAQ
jgi:hypothetical protein